MKWNKQIKIMVIRIFSWGLLYRCPCSHSEPKATPTSPGGPPIPLGRILNSCVYVLSKSIAKDRSQLWKICYLFRYFTDLPSWPWGFNLWFVQLTGEISSSFPWFHSRVQLWFGPHLHGTTTSDICSLPMWEGVKAEANRGFSSWGRVWWPHLRCVWSASGSADWQQLQQTGSCLFWWETLQLMEAGPAVWVQWHPCPCVPNNGTSFPRQTMLPLWAFLAAEPLTPVLSEYRFFFFFFTMCPFQRWISLTLNREYPWIP